MSCVQLFIFKKDLPSIWKQLPQKTSQQHATLLLKPKVGKILKMWKDNHGTIGFKNNTDFTNNNNYLKFLFSIISYGSAIIPYI